MPEARERRGRAVGPKSHSPTPQPEYTPSPPEAEAVRGHLDRRRARPPAPRVIPGGRPPQARAVAPDHPHPEDDVVSSRAWTGGSDRRWRRARERQLAEFPVCRPCEERGRVEVAVEVHHVVPLAAGGHRYDPDNLLSVCSTCHDALHGARIRGCDVDGNPLDPRARARWFARDP